MEYIRKSIYSLPEIRRAIVPLWTGWALTAAGVVCGILFIMLPNITVGWSSLLVGGIAVGVCSIVTVLCFYLFGDSRRPYHRELHALLEPTYTYYSSSMKEALTDALERHDEEALSRIKTIANPEIALVRYSDKEERKCYSQLTRVEGNRHVPLTDIIVSK